MVLTMEATTVLTTTVATDSGVAIRDPRSSIVRDGTSGHSD